MSQEIKIEINTEHFMYFNNTLTIIVKDDSEIKVKLDSIYKGVISTTPDQMISIGKISDLINSKIEEIT